MLSLYEFKKQHIGFSKYDDIFLAAVAIKFVLNKNASVCNEKLLFLGVQAVQFICTMSNISAFREYINELCSSAKYRYGIQQL